MTRWKLTIEYDGGRFSGWQRQAAGITTVQAAIEDAFFAFCQQRLTLTAAGRTDAGVHALGQVAHVDLDYGGRKLTGASLVLTLNALLRGKGVVVLAAAEVPADFHARFSAANKLYRYRIVNRPAPAAIEDGQVWRIRRALDLDAMRDAARHLLGRHDFTTFRDTACQAKSPERTLDRLEIAERPYDAFGGREIIIEAEARSFLHHQMRNMVGTLALVGDHKWEPDRVKTALDQRDRRAGGPTAPADGLCLVRVDY